MFGIVVFFLYAPILCSTTDYYSADAYEATVTTSTTANLSSCSLHVMANFVGTCWCTPLLDIRCSGLTSVPKLESLDSLLVHGGFYMAGQAIEIVPSRIFQGLQVQKIVLNFNPIEGKLSAEALEGLENVLRELYLGDCKLREVPEKMLDKMEELRHLHLWANRIESIPPGYFKNCRNLRELILWGNKLEVIDENTFSGLWNLQKLDLDKNRISSIDKRAFKHLSNLEVIHLGENQIKTLSSDMFSLVGKLRVLNLDRNKIEHVYNKAFEGLHALVSLALNHNNISFITGESFGAMKNLTTIFLHENNLQAVWPESFSSQKSLYLLNLSNNQLRDLPDGLLKQNHRLKILHVDHNHLRTVQRCIFPSSRKHPTMFHLKTLSLLGNQINCDCKMSWLLEINRNAKASVWGVCSQDVEDPEEAETTTTVADTLSFGSVYEAKSEALTSIFNPQHYVNCVPVKDDCKRVT